MPDPAYLATFTGPKGLPGGADDQSVAALVTTGTATYSAIDQQFVGTDQLVISPTAPPNPTVGLVWINNT